MSSYQVPPDMNEKEKVIGGILNINQFFWVLGGLLIGAGAFALFAQIFGAAISLILAIPICLIGTPFAIYKKNGLTLYQYLTYKRKFKNKVHKLPNIRKEVKF
ncbi:PrgI family protein [Brevibacillus sp. NPDC058079]|uniref:PrgI family protein n=1 Tax=Brevibacillus sp. NPDC058079 TaxID=3346330 RepID=UPI0036ED8A0D